MSSLQLNEADVRALVRLLGDVASARGSLVDKRWMLMRGLCDLIGADCWMWGLAPAFASEARPSFTSLSHGGFDESRLPKLLLAVEHPETWRIPAPFTRELASKRVHLTRSLRQFDPDGAAFRSPAAPLWRDANIGEAMVSLRPLEDESASLVALYRPCGSKPFERREVRIAHILLTEVPWLHQTSDPGDRHSTGPKLSPRRRMVLNLILEGGMRKDVANQLGISVHTVDGYIKDIFRYFGVHSQAELIARFRSGDGRDTPGLGD